MHRLYVLDARDASVLAPSQEGAGGTAISGADVRVADVDGEELQEAPGGAIPGRRSAAAGVVPWQALTGRAPLPSCGIPWIEDRDAETGEVFDVARHERKAMFERRGCDHAVSDAKRTSDLLTLSV